MLTLAKRYFFNEVMPMIKGKSSIPEWLSHYARQLYAAVVLLFLIIAFRPDIGFRDDVTLKERRCISLCLGIAMITLFALVKLILFLISMAANG